VRHNPDRVLIVDDDETTLDHYGRMLRIEGYEVRTTTDAEAALQEIEFNPPAAILLDLRMPVLDGLGFLQRLRVSQNHRTPVAIITGDYFIDDRMAAQLAAFDADVRYKPLWVEDLKGVVEKLLASRRGST
jgi:two-component system, OmpR family, response regulator PrrA